MRGLRPRNAPSPTTPAASSVWQYDLGHPRRPELPLHHDTSRVCARAGKGRRGNSHISPTFNAITIESPLQKYWRCIPSRQTAHSTHCTHTEYGLVIANFQQFPFPSFWGFLTHSPCPIQGLILIRKTVCPTGRDQVVKVPRLAHLGETIPVRNR